ncbi:V-type proton ATPase 16 kDa proteolipid [Datura stramonium]|uniref:V-type proton ATPase 16 kDa proteolipid n=1 Tax=Datura stramonium TaxID=4076 RepID=A0ABS8RRI9_DATST|nr:V-type proton ATPase 16 kDa proteolipid [Datura stramonium]
MTSTFSGDETAPFFGFLGRAARSSFSPELIENHGFDVGMGAAYGTAKSGVGVASMGSSSARINPKTKSYYLFDGYAHLSSGLACGLAGLSAGMAIGIVGDAGVRCFDGNLIKNTEGYVLRRPITRGQQRMKVRRMQICKPARKKINEDFNGKGYS